MSFRIKSSNMTLGKEGDVLEEKEIPEGINIEALVEGGHLEVVAIKTKSSDKE